MFHKYHNYTFSDFPVSAWCLGRWSVLVGCFKLAVCFWNIVYLCSYFVKKMSRYFLAEIIWNLRWLKTLAIDVPRFNGHLVGTKSKNINNLWCSFDSIYILLILNVKFHLSFPRAHQENTIYNKSCIALLFIKFCFIQ